METVGAVAAAEEEIKKTSNFEESSDQVEKSKIGIMRALLQRDDPSFKFPSYNVSSSVHPPLHLHVKSICSLPPARLRVPYCKLNKESPNRDCSRPCCLLMSAARSTSSRQSLPPHAVLLLRFLPLTSATVTPPVAVLEKERITAETASHPLSAHLR